MVPQPQLCLSFFLSSCSFSCEYLQNGRQIYLCEVDFAAFLSSSSCSFSCEYLQNGRQIYLCEVDFAASELPAGFCSCEVTWNCRDSCHCKMHACTATHYNVKHYKWNVHFAATDRYLLLQSETEVATANDSFAPPPSWLSLVISKVFVVSKYNLGFYSVTTVNILCTKQTAFRFAVCFVWSQVCACWCSFKTVQLVTDRPTVSNSQCVVLWYFRRK